MFPSWVDRVQNLVSALMHLDMIFPSIIGLTGEQCILTAVDDASSTCGPTSVQGSSSG
jgi:hypothetical protein